MSEEARSRLESRSGGLVSPDFDPAMFRPVKKGHLVRNPNGTMVLINEANSQFLVNEDIARLWDKSHGGKTVYELACLAAGELQPSPASSSSPLSKFSGPCSQWDC